MKIYSMDNETKGGAAAEGRRPFGGVTSPWDFSVGVDSPELPRTPQDPIVDPPGKVLFRQAQGNRTSP